MVIMQTTRPCSARPRVFLVEKCEQNRSVPVACPMHRLRHVTSYLHKRGRYRQVMPCLLCVLALCACCMWGCSTQCCIYHPQGLADSIQFAAASSTPASSSPSPTYRITRYTNITGDDFRYAACAMHYTRTQCTTVCNHTQAPT